VYPGHSAGFPPGTAAPAPSLLWRVRVGGRPQSVGGQVYVWEQGGALTVLDEASGVVVDRHAVAGGPDDGRPLVDDTMAFYRGSHDGRPALHAYSLRERTPLWRREIPGRLTDLAAGRSEIVAVTPDEVAVFDKNNGALRWTHRLRWSWRRPGLVCDEDVIYLTAEGQASFGSPGYVLALDVDTGDIRWMYCAGGEIRHPPVLGDGGVFVGESGSDHRHVYRLSPSPRTRLGEQVWRHDLGSLATHGTVAGDVVYWGSHDGHLHALDAGTGVLRWRFRARGPMAKNGPPCVHGDWVFAGAADGHLYGLDARSGGLRWKAFVADEDRGDGDPDPEPDLADESDLEGLDPEERREMREWDAELGPDSSEASKNAAVFIPPWLDVWSTRRHVFLRAEGALSCFDIRAPR
jgi:eukaryotic-like serine/threonine-protein kinase